MDSQDQEIYLQKLREYIFDEDKIVTFTWLSRQLKLATESCKTLLSTFVSDLHEVKSNMDLGLTYCLIGTSIDNQGMITLSKECDLEENKKRFNAVSSEFIYSLQKSKTVDMNAINMVNMQQHSAPLVGSVVSVNCVKRIIKEKPAPSVTTKTAIVDKSKGSHLFASKSLESNLSTENKIKTEDSVSSKPGKTIVKCKSNIENFFNKSASKLNLQIASKSDEIPKLKEEIESNYSQDSITKNISIGDELKENKEIESNVKSKTSNKNSTKDRRSSKRQRTENDEKAQKRRKRIIERNDSDSDDMFGNASNEENENIVDNVDDELSFVKERHSTQESVIKNKKRKLMDKTFTDEEGFIITSKEWVYESGSEPEISEDRNSQNSITPLNQEEKTPLDNKKQKLQPQKKSTSDLLQDKDKSPTSNKNGKGKKSQKQKPVNQPTLMSFFKKK